MFEYQRLAKKYGVEIEFLNALQLLSARTQFPSKIDVGFCADEGDSVTKIFSLFRRERVGPGVYVYGNCATRLAKFLPDDERLCGTLRLVLAQYAYAVEWSGQKLNARINVYQGDPRQDGTTGERLLSALSEIAEHLSRIQPSQLDALTMPLKWWGPCRLRTLVMVAGSALPFVVLVALVTYFSLHPAHPFIR